MSNAESNGGFFNKKQQQQAIEWLKSKWPSGNLTCESCGTNQWTLADFLVVSPRFEGGMSIGGAVAPLVMINCNNCANTKHFNAVQMGILDRKKEEEDASKH